MEEECRSVVRFPRFLPMAEGWMGEQRGALLQGLPSGAEAPRPANRSSQRLRIIVPYHPRTDSTSLATCWSLSLKGVPGLWIMPLRDPWWNYWAQALGWDLSAAATGLHSVLNSGIHGDPFQTLPQACLPEAQTPRIFPAIGFLRTKAGAREMGGGGRQGPEEGKQSF